jgi:hypothetical protein
MLTPRVLRLSTSLNRARCHSGDSSRDRLAFEPFSNSLRFRAVLYAGVGAASSLYFTGLGKGLTFGLIGWLFMGLIFFPLIGLGPFAFG